MINNKNIFRLASIVLLSSALTSCGIYSKYEAKTSSDVDSTLFGNSVQVGDSSRNIALVSWRDFFHDPELQDLITICLDNNIDMQVARMHVDEAEAGLKSSRLAYLPSLSLAPNGALTSYDGDKAAKTYQIPLTASWQVDIFGSIRNQKEQSLATRDQMLDARQAVQTNLVAAATSTYYTIAMLDEQLDIARTTERVWAQSVQVEKALKDAGRATQVAVSQLEAAWHEIQTSVLSLENSRHSACNALSLLLNEVPESRVNIHPVLDVDYFRSSPLCVGVPCQLLDNRPDVRVAENQLRAAFYAVGAAQSDFFPKLNLSGTFGWTNTTGSVIINPAITIAQLIGSLTQPIFQNGRLLAQRRVAKDELEIAAANFQHTLLSAGNEVNNYVDANQKARENAALYTAQVEALKKAYESVRLMKEIKDATYLEVLTAQQSLLNAQLDEVANRYEEVQSVINLYTALGGGRE